MTPVYVTSIAAQETAPETIKTVNYTQKGNPPTGPNQVVIEHDQGLATHTIYRPVTLTSKEPVLVWGEGGCAKNGLTFPEYISEIASYGYVVLADGPPVENTGGRGGAKGPGGPGSAGAAKGGPGAGAAKGKSPAGNGTMVNGAPLIAGDRLDGERSEGLQKPLL